MKTLLRILAILAVSFVILLTSGFFVLKRGIDVSKLTFSNIHINETHLQLNEKLELEIQKIIVEQPEEKSSGKFSPSHVRTALNAVSILEKWFASFKINQVFAGPLTASFHYQEDSGGMLNVSSPQAELKSIISLVSDFIASDKLLSIPNAA